MNTGPLEPLAKLSDHHDLVGFASGATELDDWLKQRALEGQAVGNATVFVVEHELSVVGYYALASAGVEHGAAPGTVKRNAPDPIPVLLLARLAVDARAQGRGIGRRLIQDALIRALRISDDVGFRAILVHCRDEAARDFYVRHVPAFVASPTEALDLMLPLKQLRDVLAIEPDPRP